MARVFRCTIIGDGQTPETAFRPSIFDYVISTTSQRLIEEGSTMLGILSDDVVLNPDWVNDSGITELQ